MIWWSTLKRKKKGGEGGVYWGDRQWCAQACVWVASLISLESSARRHSFESVHVEVNVELSIVCKCLCVWESKSLIAKESINMKLGKANANGLFLFFHQPMQMAFNRSAPSICCLHESFILSIFTQQYWGFSNNLQSCCFCISALFFF